MFPNVVEIVVKATTPKEAKAKADLAAIVANNLSLEALNIISEKAQSKDMSGRIIKFQKHL